MKWTPLLARQGASPLLGLAGQQPVDPGLEGVPAGAPHRRLRRSPKRAHRVRTRLKAMGSRTRQRRDTARSARPTWRPAPAESAHANADLPAAVASANGSRAARVRERARDQRVVADLRVSVERQVVGGEADLRAEQQPAVARAARRRRERSSPLPEQSVVEATSSSAPTSERELEQLDARRNAARDRPALRAGPSDLQPVRAMIFEGPPASSSRSHSAKISVSASHRGDGAAPAVWDTATALSGRGAAW